MVLTSQTGNQMAAKIPSLEPSFGVQSAAVISMVSIGQVGAVNMSLTARQLGPGIMGSLQRKAQFIPTILRNPSFQER